MRDFIKKRKKKGFTLIEMVAVVAIIGILAAILVPKITGYMKEAKKTGVIDQARKVAQAYQTAEMKDKLKDGEGTGVDTTKSTQVSTVKNKTMLSLLDMTNPNTNTTAGELKYELKKLLGEAPAAGTDKAVSIQDCIDITDGAEFNVNGDGTLIRGSIKK